MCVYDIYLQVLFIVIPMGPEFYLLIIVTTIALNI